MQDDELAIAFGRGSLPITLPTGAAPTVIRKAVLPKLPDNGAAIRHAFDHPVDAPRCVTSSRGARAPAS